MHDKERHSETETFVPYDHLTSKTEPLDTISQIRDFRPLRPSHE